MKNVFIIAFTLFLVVGCNSQKNATTSNNGVSSTAPSKRANNGQNRGGPPSVEEVFKMDSNGDGMLSASEIDGPLKRDFSKIDANGDGFISRTELENAPKPERGQRPPRNN